MRGLRLALALLAATWLGAAAALSYTVQVIALSDRDRAESLERSLLLDGYPAYLVETTTAMGEIFRVRVGAFGNRDAALAYADAMAGVAGSRPVPALADDVPLRGAPLLPRLLGRFSAEERLELLPWRGSIAVRAQEEGGREEARYAVPVDGAVVYFRAWRAVPIEGGAVLRLRSLPLWPDDWRQREEPALEAYRQALLRSLADRLGMEPEELERWPVTPADEAPYLLVVERFEPMKAEPGEPVALALPDGAPRGHGPTRLIGTLPGLPSPAPLLELGGEPELPEEVAGGGWVASRDGSFLRLLPDGAEGPAAWRSGVGAPVWAGGELLLAYARGTYYLYAVGAP